MRARLLLIGLATLAVGVGGLQLGLGASDPPSIVFIVTDDQRWDTLDGMPTVRERIARPGIQFRNAFSVNPLCCPSRASILTGQYSHTTKIYRNRGKYGGFKRFKDRSTLPVWLSSAGYSTGLFGKYLNRYRNTTYVPPGWSRWVGAMARPSDPGDPLYFNYHLNLDGTIKRHGSDPDDYLTDVIADHAVSWIRNTTGPLFLYFTPVAPHGPFTPAPRHAGLPVPKWTPRPNFNERDVSDKPAYIRAKPRLTEGTRIGMEKLRAKQYRTLMAVDEAVDRILDALEDTGRLSNTLIVFTSDHGMGWGEHRWARHKQVPHEETIRVPFVVRFDPLVSEPRTDDRLVLNIDLAPTAADLANVTAPGAEGGSFAPLLESEDAPWRSDFLVEHLVLEEPPAIPTYCAVRNERYTYVLYETKEKELYDLAKDPYQLRNRASDPAYLGVRRELRTRLRQLCDPPPPGMTAP